MAQRNATSKDHWIGDELLIRKSLKIARYALCIHQVPLGYQKVRWTNIRDSGRIFNSHRRPHISYEHGF